VRLAPGMRQHFLQDFLADSNRIGHAVECTSGRMADSGWV